MKCPICGQDNLKNINDKRHIKGRRHQNALKSQKKLDKPKGQKLLTPRPQMEQTSVKTIVIPSAISHKFNEIESRINKIESQLRNIISPVKKIDLENFLVNLIKEYRWLNPNNDIHGVELDLLKRRVSRNLEISELYFEDLLYDILKTEENVSLMKERNQTRVIVKQKLLRQYKS